MAGNKYPKSLGQLSRETGLRAYHLSKILNGRGTRPENLAKVAEALQMSVAEFRARWPRIYRYRTHRAARAA